MKTKLAWILAILLILSPSIISAKKAPQLVLLQLKVGEESAPIPGKGTWESEHTDIATVTKEGLITAQNEGYTLVLLKNDKGEVAVRAEVQVGHKPVPEVINQVIATAIADWEAAAGQPFPKYNQYTQWFNPAAKNGFGWCGAFVGQQFDLAGIEMNPEYRAKKAPPLSDGSLFAVRQASQTKLYEGFESRNRLSNLPREGYYIIYGKRGSTPYTHVGLITKVVEQGQGVYLLETVEGNLGSRIKRFSYLYDSLAEKKERNITSLPEGMQTQPELFNYTYVKDFYINAFGQTWY